MGNVWEAMRKHQAEKEQRGPDEPKPDARPGGARPTKAAKPPTPRPGSVSISRARLARRYAKALVVHHDRGGRITEQYRALRTHFLAQCPDGRICMLVTSAESGEGKTVSCLNLALVIAERQERSTIVVDGDLRKGRVATLVGDRVKLGLADVLRGKAALEDVVRPTLYPNLFYVSSGNAVDREVGELMGGPELEETVGELRRGYDCVLFDTPPVNVVADAATLGGPVGEALLVVRMNKTHREAVERAIGLLRGSNVKVNGIVLTHQKYFVPKYLYRYS